jgi:hypothetical protein
LPRDNGQLGAGRSTAARAAVNILGDRLAAVAELGDDELAVLNGVIDGLVAKSRLRALAGGVS